MSEPAPKPNISAGEPPLHAPTHAAESGNHAAASANVFSDAEWDQLRAEDYSAGKAVVILMVGIFSSGVVLYSVVASTVMM